MPKKPREMEKIILADAGYFKRRSVPTATISTHQNPAKLQFLFIVKTYRKGPKILF